MTCWTNVPPSSAHVKFVTSNKATFQDGVQFDDPDQTGWNLTNKTFRMDIKANAEASSFLLSFASGDGEIVVDNVTTRIIHFNVPESEFDPTVIPPGEYVYDFVMSDDSTPAIRTQLMYGEFILVDGITGG